MQASLASDVYILPLLEYILQKKPHQNELMWLLARFEFNKKLSF